MNEIDLEMDLNNAPQEQSSNKRKGISLCYPYEEKRLLKWQRPWIIMPKLDGVRCRLLFQGGVARLLSSEQNEIEGVPHILEAVKELKVGSQIELDGELYLHGLSFEEIFSITSRSSGNLHPMKERIQFHLFDLPSAGNLSQIERLQILSAFPNTDYFKIVPWKIVDKLESVYNEMENYIGRGYEGFVLRNIGAEYLRRRTTNWMKFKPKKKDFYKIIGFHQEISIEGYEKNSLGALECQGFNTLEHFKVGTGFSAEQRRSLWFDRFNLIGKTVSIKYQALTPGRGVPRFPVFAELIDQDFESFISGRRPSQR